MPIKNVEVPEILAKDRSLLRMQMGIYICGQKYSTV